MDALDTWRAARNEDRWTKAKAVLNQVRNTGTWVVSVTCKPPSTRLDYFSFGAYLIQYLAYFSSVITPRECLLVHQYIIQLVPHTIPMPQVAPLKRLALRAVRADSVVTILMLLLAKPLPLPLPHLPRNLQVYPSRCYVSTPGFQLTGSLAIRFKPSPFFRIDQAISAVVECPG